VLLIAVSLGVATFQLDTGHGQISTSPSSTHATPSNTHATRPDPLDVPTAAPSVAAVESLVRKSTRITSVPVDLNPPLADADTD
jgi:hypothetical protein